MIKVAILDDYQNVFEQIIDTNVYKDKFEFKYFAKNVCDDDPTTAWVEGNADYGVGEFLEFTEYSDEYYKKFENRILNAHFLPLNDTIVGNEFVRKNHLGKEEIEEVEIKFFKLFSYNNDVVLYKEIILEPVETEKKQLQIW